MNETLLSQNGWIASSDPAVIGIRKYPVKGTTSSLRCNEQVAPLLIGLAQEFHEYIEPIDAGTLDDWGYAFRMVRGSTAYISNHGSGTAIDLNAASHPLGRVGTFPNAKVPMIRALAKKYGCRWGGDYNMRKDEMHFEIALSPAKAAELIVRLGETHE